MTQRCGNVLIGNAKWLVYASTGTDFSATATDYALPPGYTGGFFYAGLYSGPAQCMAGNNIPGFAVIDLLGTGRPDLVVTGSCSDMAVGQSRWLLYRNTPTGFSATATDFAIPAEYTRIERVDTLAMLQCMGGQNVPRYGIRDLDGDGRPDLIVTQRCGNVFVGATKWLLYRNTGAGFAAAVDVALPAEYSGGFTYLDSGGVNCMNGENQPNHWTLDLTGDRRLDVVVTQRCGNVLVGNAKWLVYPVSCM